MSPMVPSWLKKWYPTKPLPTPLRRFAPGATGKSGYHQGIDVQDRPGSVTMPVDDPETEARLRQAARGDGRALHWLLDRHRDRLRRMIAVRLDDRLSSR